MTFLNLKLKFIFIGNILPRGEEDLALCMGKQREKKRVHSLSIFWFPVPYTISLLECWLLQYIQERPGTGADS